ncbi:MAG TPA: GrpB family protein [Pyrinomonadaceae bacterium]|nr:GrpB family protein [Pyrinomonadaceae bacterium]
METLAERIERVLQEQVSIVPYDPNWPTMFAEERDHLLESLPPEMIGRIEHFGSTAIPGLAAKPIVDMLVEVRSLEETKSRIVPVLEAQGYDYFWRPTRGDDGPPFYAWFINRDAAGVRTHHIHMVEKDFAHWERLLFRDYLIEHPEVAKEYEALKLRLADNYPNDRVAYTNGKTDYVVRITQVAKEYYKLG